MTKACCWPIHDFTPITNPTFGMNSDEGLLLADTPRMTGSMITWG